MPEPETFTTESAGPGGDGFQISDQPVVRNAAEARNAGALPSSYGVDLLYVIARDPNSLFLYWDLNWSRLFAKAALSPRQVHLRVYRGDGSIEGTWEINPFRGHCYVDVAAAGATYYCELGCFEDEEWKSLSRSGATATPEAAISEDLSKIFATLPLHLSFQRLLEIFRTSQADSKTLANSLAQLQENARVLRENLAPAEWSLLMEETAAALNRKDGDGASVDAAELSALLQSARPEPERTAAEERAKWQELSDRVGGSSWSGASEQSAFGGSSPA